MIVRTSLRLFTGGLLTALGLAPLACSDDAPNDEGPTGTAGDGSSVGGAPSAGAPNGGAAGDDTLVEGENRFPCENPQPVGGEESGVFQCESGMIHRAFAGTCASELPRADPLANGKTPELPNECEYDSDCTDAEHGYCYEQVGLLNENVCLYGCVEDTDCAADKVCVCNAPPYFKEGPETSPIIGNCIDARCRSDADCDPGFQCALEDAYPACHHWTLSCQTAEDECSDRSDCTSEANSLITCTTDGSDGASHRICTEASCTFGRPWLVAGTPRSAPRARRSDWQRELASVRPTSPALCARLASEWARAAELEHASVAAFARFTLELLSLGAPAELVELSGRAMADEIEHARLCFALASQYAGQPLGPAALDVTGALDGIGLEAALVSAVIEGCVGETLAALDAAEAARHASDPVVRELLARIAEDETRHAELAWRFLRWGLAQPGGGSARVARVRAAFEAARCGMTDHEPSAERCDEAELLAAGVLPAHTRSELRRQAFDEVVVTCAHALGVFESRAGNPAGTSLYQKIA